MLVVGTIRDEEVPPQHPLRTMLLHMRSTIRIAELALQPLDLAETAQLAAQIESRELDADAAMWLYRETEGNPLFVVETMRAGLEQRLEIGGGRSESTHQSLISNLQALPPRVHAVIAGRLAQLSAPARALAGLVAAIGRAFTLDLLLEAGHTDEDSTVRA